MTNKVTTEKELAAARLAHALSHPVRLRILELLSDEGAYVMHLTSILGRPQANISQHLAILRDAGLVADKREGMTVVYSARDGRVFDLMDRLFALAGRVAEAPESRWHEDGPGMRPTGPGRGGQCHCPRCAR